MSLTTIVICIIEIVLGLLINVFMGKLVKIIFNKDGTFPRLPLRVLGIFLLINGASTLLNFHIL